MKAIFDTISQITETGKSVTDHVAVVGIVLTFAQWLPAIAAGMSCVWYAIRIYEWVKRKHFGQAEPADE